MINHYDYLAITLLDALAGVDPVKICVGYKYKGESLKTWPIQSEIIEKCSPEYIEMPGWEPLDPEKWSEIAKSGFDALPENIQNYLYKIQDILGIEFAIISIGPNRSDTIIKKTAWS